MAQTKKKAKQAAAPKKKAATKKVGAKKKSAPKRAPKKPVAKAARAKATPKTAPTSKPVVVAKPAAPSVPKPVAQPKPAPQPKPAAAKPAPAPRTGAGITAADVNLGHIAGLKPRTHTGFKPEAFQEAKRLLADARYATIAEAARAVAEKATELSNESGPTPFQTS